MKIFKDKRIVLGVTGSIAAYKAVSLASSLTKAGALVDVILTDAASKLVSPISYSSVTGRKAYLDSDLWQVEDHVLHIELGEKNDAFIIAPATANTIAKLAHGLADTLLTLSALASRTAPLVAPAMDGGMYSNPATQENIQTLSERGMKILGPATGHLASGLSGMGRMLEPDELFGHLRLWLGEAGSLSGRKVVVSAGGTQEPIDPVRVITNKSSGKQGYAVAQAALDQGASVTLISAPTCLKQPVGVDLVSVTTAEEMKNAVLDACEVADLLVMTAAVADYRPRNMADDKIKKDKGGLTEIQLDETTDILGEVAKIRKKKDSSPKVVIGFAAETENLLKNAEKKLKSKGLDLIAANDVSREDSGIGADQNQVTLIWKDGKTKELPLMAKSSVADELIEAAAAIIEG